MKTIIIPVCVLLGLLHANVRAQVDSNFTIILSCGPVGGSCSFLVTCTQTYPETTWTEQAYGSLSCTISDTLISPQNGEYGPNFTIDTLNRVIRGLEYEVVQDHYYNHSTQKDGLDELLVSIDTMPYRQDLDGRIRLAGRFLAYTSFYSSRSASSHIWSYRGGCEEYDSVMDSVWLEIIPASLAGVSPVQRKDVLLSTRYDGITSDATFTPSSKERNFEFFDLFGRSVLRLLVTPDESSIPLPNSLLPGLYFARLGDQVAKFVVPPR